MSRRLTPLGADDVDDLPERCRRCLFWELGEHRPSDAVDASSTARSDRVRKQAWTTSQAIEAGPPGVVVRDAGRVLGYASFAPVHAYAPRGASAATASLDALLLATVWLHPDARGSGVGRQIVAAALREAIRLDLEAVEAYGDRRAREWDCVLPATWLLHQGFEVEVEHPRYPLLRLDVKRAARWAESLEHAMDTLLGRSTRTAGVAVPTLSSSVEMT